MSRFTVPCRGARSLIVSLHFALFSLPGGLLLAGFTPAPAHAAESEQAQLTVQVQGDEGTILLDDKEVGQGSFSGLISSGRHELKVTRTGFEDHLSVLALRHGEVHSMGVTLRQRVTAGLKSADSYGGVAPSTGLYGGVKLLGVLQPNGSGSSLQTSCATLGANRCTEGSGLGAGLSGYVGFLLAPVGLELSLLLSGDSTSPTASFDGTSGSDINPVVASPARTEKFRLGRFGGGAALRVRIAKRLSQLDFSFAAGPGLMYRVFAMSRDTTSFEGNTSAFADAGASYFSPYISLEGAIGLRIGATTSIALGLVSWIEHAGDSTKSRREDRAVIEVGSNPVFPQNTPEYDLASGAQWFIGPFVGLSFGQ